MGQREMAQMIIDGLRPQPGRSVGLDPYDTAADGDIEEDFPRTGIRRRRAPKRRSPQETALSVSCTSFQLLEQAYTRIEQDSQIYEQAH
jgi:hypothetical protein